MPLFSIPVLNMPSIKASPVPADVDDEARDDECGEDDDEAEDPDDEGAGSLRILHLAGGDCKQYILNFTTSLRLQTGFISFNGVLFFCT